LGFYRLPLWLVWNWFKQVLSSPFLWNSYGFYWLPKRKLKIFWAIGSDYQYLTDLILENFLGHFRTKNLIILTATLAQSFCSLNFTRKKHCFKDVCPTLKACVVTSEMLLKTTKTSRETTGNSNYQRVRRVRTRFNRFSRNTERRMGINAETLFVEILDDKGLFFPKKGHCNHFFQQSPSVYSLWYWRYWVLDEKALYKDLFCSN
jgi:hypothetical protein